MKLSELNTNTDYAVIPSWTYTSKENRTPEKIRENDVVKARIVSLQKYQYQPSVRQQSVNDFALAKEGERSIAILVTAKDSTGTDFYWTSRLADIVAEWKVLEPRWTARKTAENEARRQAEEKQRKEHEARLRAEEEVARSRNSVVATAKELLGEKTSAEVSINGYGEAYRGVVSISLAEFEQLIEMAYAGKDNY